MDEWMCVLGVDVGAEKQKVVEGWLFSVLLSGSLHWRRLVVW